VKTQVNRLFPNRFDSSTHSNGAIVGTSSFAAVRVPFKKWQRPDLIIKDLRGGNVKHALIETWTMANTTAVIPCDRGISSLRDARMRIRQESLAETSLTAGGKVQWV